MIQFYLQYVSYITELSMNFSGDLYVDCVRISLVKVELHCYTLTNKGEPKIHMHVPVRVSPMFAKFKATWSLRGKFCH